MAISALTPPNPSDNQLETRIEFPDNRLLIDLFGEFNRNLAQIEEALTVQIMHQGNQLTVFGEAGAVNKAAVVLQALYGRLEAGKEIAAGDIDAEIRMGAGEENPGIGPAGTGKTYLAVAVGVNLFIGGHIDKIILSRPAVEAGERLGFLPGDMKDKVDPYMQPLYDALNDFLPGKQLARMLEEKRIEIAPLAFMRGRTLANA